MDSTINGPRLAPASGDRATQLVVLLHGYGANGDDLIGLAREWQERFPQAVFVAPNAPEPVPMMPLGGYQWFKLTFRDEDELWRGTQAASPMLERFLESELRRHELRPEALALVGFSQGTMMALHVGLTSAISPAAIVGYSGIIAGPGHLKSKIRSRPPVILIHGEADDLISVDAIHITREALAQVDVSVEWHIRPRLCHGIDQEGLELGESFLAQVFEAHAP